MSETAIPVLANWESFYVIVGSSAAALTGLQFVVIALGAESKSMAISETVAAFGTPTIVHFCAVLLISAMLSMPDHTPSSLGWCVGLTGLLGLSYVGWVVVRARRQKGYQPVFEDWLFHTILPIMAYAGVGVAALMLHHHTAAALYLIASAALLLMLIGIHNAWDAAVWMASQRKR